MASKQQLTISCNPELFQFRVFREPYRKDVLTDKSDQSWIYSIVTELKKNQRSINVYHKVTMCIQ